MSSFGFAALAGFVSPGAGFGVRVGLATDLGAATFGAVFAVPGEELDSTFDSCPPSATAITSCFTAIGSVDTMSVSNATDCGNDEEVIPASMKTDGYNFWYSMSSIFGTREFLLVSIIDSKSAAVPVTTHMPRNSYVTTPLVSFSVSRNDITNLLSFRVSSSIFVYTWKWLGDMTCWPDFSSSALRFLDAKALFRVTST